MWTNQDMQTLFQWKKLAVLEYVLCLCAFTGDVSLFFLATKFEVLEFVLQVTVVKNEEGGNSVATVLLRGSTDSILDDLERAVDDGVNTYKVYL